MLSKDGRFALSFNGEIYNHKQIRETLLSKGLSFSGSSDTEVLLHAYATWGPSCLDRLIGMFAFAIWDSHTRKLFLARDRFGEKPLYYTQHDKAFYFASEIKALIAMTGHIPNPDPVALDGFLSCDYILEPRTPFMGVVKLQSAHTLEMANPTDIPKARRWWALTACPPRQGDPATEIRQALEEAVVRSTTADVPVGIALSAGLDSSSIALLLAPHAKSCHSEAFTIGYEGRPESDERGDAQSLAQTLGIPFHEHAIDLAEFAEKFPALILACDTPIADIALFGHYCVARLAGQHQFKILLSGNGGDELFWGYQHCLDCIALSTEKQRLRKLGRPLLRALHFLSHWQITHRACYSRKIPAFMRGLAKALVSLRKLGLDSPDTLVFQEYHPHYQEYLRIRNTLLKPATLKAVSARNPIPDFLQSPDNPDAIPLGICQLTFSTWFTSNCLTIADSVSMAHGVEMRCPLLDRVLTETVIGHRLSAPDHALGLKHHMKAALNDLLPRELVQRQKRGFQPPIAHWEAESLARWGHTLETGHLVQEDLVEATAITTLRQKAQDSPAARHLLYRLLVWEIYMHQMHQSFR